MSDASMSKEDYEHVFGVDEEGHDLSAFREEVKEMLDHYPNLGDFGWANRCIPEAQFNSDHKKLYGRIEEIKTAIQYLAFHPIPKGKSSYGLKHDIEYWTEAKGERQYISNGAAILGALIYGYTPKCEPNSPNCGFRR